MKRSLLSSVVAVLISALPLSGQAIVVSIDEFALDKGGTNTFIDRFDNGTTPSQEARYAVRGSFPNGAESGGALTLNSDWGAISPNGLGRTLGVTLKSSFSPSDNDVEVAGLFNLVVPVGPISNAYGIQVVNTALDFGVDLLVAYSPVSGESVIAFLSNDRVNGILTLLGGVPLAPPPGANQIVLDIVKPDAGGRAFYGAYAFCNSGTCRDEDFVIFDTPFTLSGPEYAGTFFANSAIPEPGSLALLGLGLAGLAASRRRKP